MYNATVASVNGVARGRCGCFEIIHTECANEKDRPATENAFFCVFEPPLGDLGTTYDDHLRLVGKRVGDFLLVLIELHSLGRTRRYERLSVKNRRFRANAGRLTQNFR